MAPTDLENLKGNESPSFGDWESSGPRTRPGSHNSGAGRSQAETMRDGQGLESRAEPRWAERGGAEQSRIEPSRAEWLRTWPSQRPSFPQTPKLKQRPALSEPRCFGLQLPLPSSAGRPHSPFPGVLPGSRLPEPRPGANLTEYSRRPLRPPRPRPLARPRPYADLSDWRAGAGTPPGLSDS